MAKILLIQPPVYKSEYSVRGSGHTLSILPPLGLAYIAAHLKNNGHQCEIIDGLAAPLSLDAIAVKAAAFDYIGITAVTTFYLRVREIIGILRKDGVKAPIIVGGPHATVLPDLCLKNGADYVVIGEGELTMLELVNALSGKGDAGNVNGIAFLRDGGMIRTPARPLIPDLDGIPPPARELLPMGKYKMSEARTKKQPSHSLLTSRGCPGNCSFCNKAIFGTRVRYFSVKRIVEECFLLRDVYGARDVAVWDDNFFANHAIAHGVCDELIKNRFNTTWSAEARIDSVDRDILRHAKEAGCDFVAYGIESGSQRVLDSMNKHITLEQIRKTVQVTREAGINIRAYFMMGLPGEMLQDMDKTVSFAKELAAEVASFTLFVPLPGTVEYGRALKTGVFPDPEYYLHGVYPEFNFPDAPLYIPEGMTADRLMEKHKSAYNRYYFRLSFLLKSLLSIRTTQDITRYAKGMLNLLGNAFMGEKK